MIYDRIVNKINNKGFVINYGIKSGNSKIVLIKAGKGGNIFSSSPDLINRYETLTEIIFNKYGYTVIVASNPKDDKEIYNHLEDDMQLIEEINCSDNIIYIGYSAGATYGAWFSYLYHRIEKVLLINPALMLNLHWIMKNCENTKVKVTFALGENDSSFAYKDFIPLNENIKIVILNNQGHHIDDEIFFKTINNFLNF